MTHPTDEQPDIDADLLGDAEWMASIASPPAPAPADERAAMIEAVLKAQTTWQPDETSSTRHIADTLLADGWTRGGAEAGLREALASLSSYLGAGMGDETTTPEEFEQRIRWGIDHHASGIIALAAATVERLSKQPNTTWGEVKSAILALARPSAPETPEPRRCAECDCEGGEYECNWIKPGPSAPETLAWAVVGKDGVPKVWSVSSSEKACRTYADPYDERAVRVAIRMVEDEA